MNNLSVVLPRLFSELLINLSAGFLGAAIIIPVQTSKTGKFQTIVFIANIGLSCAMFACAVILNI